LVARSHRRGAELVAQELAAELDALGYDDRVVALGPAVGGGEEQGLAPLVATEGDGPVALARRIWKVRRLLAAEPADVIMAHGGWAAQVAVLASGRGGPLLVWQRILGFPTSVWRSGRRSWWKIIVRRVDACVALTRELEHELRELGFTGPVWLIPNSRRPDRFLGVDRAEAASRLRSDLGLPPDVPLVGFVGHLVRQKRPERAIDMLHHLRQLDRSACLVIAGDGPLRPNLESQVRSLGLSSAVTFLGHRPDVEEVLGGVDVAVLTSEAEGIPGVAIEAVMVGCPLVSVPVGGVAEVIDDGVTGVVLSDCDPARMATVVAGLLADPERRRGMSLQGRRAAGSFAAATAAATFADHLDAALTAARAT
jgi:glycosyltransferase involved in cell wall biosynthesis